MFPDFGEPSADPAGRLYQATSGSTATQFLWEGDKLIAEYNATSGAMAQRHVPASETARDRAAVGRAIIKSAA